MVTNDSTPVPQPIDNRNRRALTCVRDVIFVGDTDHENARVAHGLRIVVKRLRDEIHDIVGHLGIDVVGQLDEARDNALSRLSN